MPLNSISQPVTPRPLGDAGGVDRAQQGRVGHRSVAALSGAEPRAGEARSFGQKVADLFSRTIGTLTGGARRAAPVAYADMSQADQQRVRDRMGTQAEKALGALARGDGARVKVADGSKAFARLAETAVPLKGDANAQTVLRGVLDTAVASLDADGQLAALRGLRSDRGASVQGRLSENPDANKALVMLEQALVTRLSGDAYQTAAATAATTLREGLDAARTGTGDAFSAGVPRHDDPHAQSLARDGFTAAKHALSSHYNDMASLGLKPDSKNARNAFVAQESLSLLAGTGNDSAAPIDSVLLKGLDSMELQSISAQAADAASVPRLGAALRQIGGELETRLNSLQAKMREDADMVMSFPHDAPANAEGLAFALGAAADAMVQAGRFATRFGLDDGEVTAMGARLAAHVDRLADNGNLALGDVPDAALHRLETALRAVGSDTAAGLVSGEADNRREALRTQYHNALDGVLNAVRNDDMTALINAARASGPVRDEVARALEPLGLKLDGADEMMAARAMLVDTRLATLGTDDLVNLFGTLERPDMRALTFGLSEGAYDLIEIDVDAFRDSFNAGTDLMLLHNAVKEQLESRGVSLPPRPDADVRDGLATMSPQGFQAIRSALNIDANQNGMTRLVGGEVRGERATRFEAAATVRPGTESQLSRHTIGGQELDVCRQFGVDLGRATFTSNGQPLLVRDHGVSRSVEETEQRLHEAVNRLVADMGGDRDLAFAVSQYANQSPLAAVAEFSHGPDFMIRLQDGTPGTIIGGGQSSTYDIERTDTGEARIQFGFTVHGNQLLDSGGNFHWLAPGEGEASFRFELTVNRDGSARLTQPLTFELNVQADEQWSDDISYARPSAMDPKSALDPHRSPGLRDELYDFARSNYAEENIDFYEAVEEYRQAPSMEAAQALFDTFVEPGSARQVNLSNTAVDGVRNAIAGGQAGADAFDAAIPDTLQNISETLQRFVAHKQESMQ